MKTSQCKGCGEPIVWAVLDSTGKPIPLDPRPPVYRVYVDAQGCTRCYRDTPNVDPDCEVEANAMVSHFATCPNANDFSASKKKAAAV